MNVKIFIPPPSLQDVIVNISTVDVVLPQGIRDVSTPYPPTPFQSLIFYCGHQISMNRLGETFGKQPVTVLLGPQFSRVNIMVHERLFAIKVDFLPGALHRLTGISMHEYLDQGMDAALVFGKELITVEKQLLELNYIEEGIPIVSNFLIHLLKKQKEILPFDEALLEMVRFNGGLKIETTASLACLSLKQFERKCRERIGMSPKMYSRILRFSKAYRLHEANPETSWTSIAHEAGYFDQMHLIRDFREFAGVNPRIIQKELLQTPFRMQKDLGW